MKRNILTYIVKYKNDKLFKYYSNTVFIAVFLDWLFLPIFISLMGLKVSVTFITLYYLLSESSGFFINYFKNYSLSKTILILLFLDITQLLIYLLYFYNINYMVYGLMVIFSIQAMYYEILINKIIKHYENIGARFSIIQNLLYVNKSFSVLLGLVVSLIISIINNDITYIIILILLLMTISIYNEYKLYRFIKDMK